MTITLPKLELQYRRNATLLPTVELQLGEIYQFLDAIKSYSPLLQDWYLASATTVSDALQYKAFDTHGPTTAALAVLHTKSKGVNDIRSISVWNGVEGDGSESVGVSSRCNVIGRPDSFSMEMKVKPEITDWKIAAQWLQKALEIWPAQFASFGPLWYGEKKVFKDRPGAAWLLYLPRVLTTQQVPEARTLVPVLGADKKQKGTIIVSVTDEQFSDQNPAHVRIANDIEIRLVDQDLLPRYADL